MNDVDDILSDLDSNDKPFASHEEEKKTPYNNSNTNWKGNKSNKPKKESLWDKTDFEPLKVDSEKLHRTGKSWMWYGFTPKTEISTETKDKLVAIANSLSSKNSDRGFIFRHNGETNDLMANKFFNLDNINIESYLPWKKYNTNVENAVLNYANETGYRLAMGYHGKFANLPSPIRAILANLCNTLLGKEGNDPVDFVICYTECGSESFSKKIDYTVAGNLGFILKICEDANIPIFNFKNNEALKNLKEFLQ